MFHARQSSDDWLHSIIHLFLWSTLRRLSLKTIVCKLFPNCFLIVRWYFFDVGKEEFVSVTTCRKNFASFVQQVLFVVKDNVEFLCKAEVASS